VRICVLGKFPPIEGGVSTQTYWTAHALARRGHDVHVVTNAKEAKAPYRMYMRAEDWSRCDACYGDGSVTVHWTDPLDHSQAHIPLNSPVVTKLATLATRAHRVRPFDVIFSYYLEPFGVAGHLAAELTGVPHVVRMAGSDAGRLWHHPQFELLYDHVLRSAQVVIAEGAGAERAREHGTSPDRIASAGGFALPEDLFVPDGPDLDVRALSTDARSDTLLKDLVWGSLLDHLPHFGVYGKLGEPKGSFALLAAMQQLKQAGVDVGLVVLAHGAPSVQEAFRARAAGLNVADRILQIPFLPHWRVPEFLRGCLAVCCLEQGFPIELHTPITPREVLLCGTCLVASTELIHKFRRYERSPHGYGCVAIADVNDPDALSAALAAIVHDPKAARAIGARGRSFALEIQRDISFPLGLERVFQAAAMRQQLPDVALTPLHISEEAAVHTRFPLTRLVAAAIAQPLDAFNSYTHPFSQNQSIDFASASRLLGALERGIAEGKRALRPMAAAVEIDIAIAAAEEDEGNIDRGMVADPLFRLNTRQLGLPEEGIARLAPVRDPRLRILKFDHDVTLFMGAKTVEDFPAAIGPGPSYMLAFAVAGGERREPLIVDGLTAQILELSDGKRSAAEIAAELTCQLDHSGDVDIVKWIENLFVRGLVLFAG
jgi:glycosyltransferase involved in cell wall biosynthesis